MVPPSTALHSGAGAETRPMLPALALGLASFLANFDVTAAVAALPTIAKGLGLGIAGYAWVMDAYSLAFTSSLLVAGALADRYGLRRAMLTGNAAFAISSLACGLAPNGPALWTARALQGIGAAFLVTGGFALLASTYSEPRARTRAFSWLGVMAGIAMALGPTIGGLVSAWAGWRWIFFVNLPACALIAWGVPRLAAEARGTAPRPLDFAGMALLTAALCILTGALLHGRPSTGALAGGPIVAIVLAGLFVRQQRKRAQPIFEPAVFMRPAMAGIAVLLMALSVAYWSILVYLPLFLTAAYGWPSHIAGFALLAATAPMLIVPPLGGAIVNRIGWRWHFAGAFAGIAIGNASFLGALAAYGSAPPLAVIGFGMIATGVGAALAHPQLSGAVVALVPAGEAGMASAVTVVLRQAGFAIGIAVLGALLGSTELAAGYFLPFAAAATVSFVGLLAALILLPARAAQTAG